MKSVDEHVELGAHAILSPGVRVMTHTHEFNKANWRKLGKREAQRDTIISNYAFIGVDAIITHSCKYVGLHSVIGAGAVVTKDVPDYEIWAGNPAKKIGAVDGDLLS